MARETGYYQILGELHYFIPHSLPPSSPPFELNADMMDLYGSTLFSIGKLNEIAQKLPNPRRFINAYVIKEALLSSAIEGIHTTLLDVFTVPLEESYYKFDKQTQLVINYTKALEAALNLMNKKGMPLVSRVILTAHEALMSGGEGDKASPGQYRKQPVRVGNLVPPPAHIILQLMSDLEQYINNDSDLPPLIRAGLVHVQFETIHPFLDGNGRIGRLLIVLMLIDSGLLTVPLLYPSYYFKKYQNEYYQRLDNVRLKGDFEGWITYYLTTIKESADDAYKRAKAIELLEEHYRQIIISDSRFSKVQEKSLHVLSMLFESPVTTITYMSKKIDKSYNTTQKIMLLFVEAGIITEMTAQLRNKRYQFEAYLQLLEKDME